MTHNPKIKWIAIGVLFGIGFLIGVFGAITGELELAEDLFRWAVVAAIVIILPVTVIWWRSLDELAREAHKSAWFWGGSIGMGLSVVPLLALSRRPKTDASGDLLMVLTDPSTPFAGAFTVLFSAMVGYYVAWAIFWLQKR